MNHAKFKVVKLLPVRYIMPTKGLPTCTYEYSRSEKNVSHHMDKSYLKYAIILVERSESLNTDDFLKPFF